VTRPRKRLRDTFRAAGLGAVLIGAIAVGGCDLQENADLDRGRELFIAKCGTCHVMEQAATAAEVGPNLDAAFAAARAAGMDQDTIEGVVQSQVANPRPASPEQTRVYMPAELVTGQDAENVAAYVGKYAGVPDVEPPTAPGGPGGQVFAQNGCGACHTMEAAGASGNSGPNLDQNLPGQSAAEIEESIVNPAAELVSGFGDIMPKAYGETISPEDLELLVSFLRDCSGDPTGPDCG